MFELTQDRLEFEPGGGLLQNRIHVLLDRNSGLATFRRNLVVLFVRIGPSTTFYSLPLSRLQTVTLAETGSSILFWVEGMIAPIRVNLGFIESCCFDPMELVSTFADFIEGSLETERRRSEGRQQLLQTAQRQGSPEHHGMHSPINRCQSCHGEFSSSRVKHSLPLQRILELENRFNPLNSLPLLRVFTLPEFSIAATQNHDRNIRTCIRCANIFRENAEYSEDDYAQLSDFCRIKGSAIRGALSSPETMSSPSRTSLSPSHSPTKKTFTHFSQPADVNTSPKHTRHPAVPPLALNKAKPAPSTATGAVANKPSFIMDAVSQILGPREVDESESIYQNLLTPSGSMLSSRLSASRNPPSIVEMPPVNTRMPVAGREGTGKASSSNQRPVSDGSILEKFPFLTDNAVDYDNKFKYRSQMSRSRASSPSSDESPPFNPPPKTTNAPPEAAEHTPTKTWPSRPSFFQMFPFLSKDAARALSPPESKKSPVKSEKASKQREKSSRQLSRSGSLFGKLFSSSPSKTTNQTTKLTGSGEASSSFSDNRSNENIMAPITTAALATLDAETANSDSQHNRLKPVVPHLRDIPPAGANGNGALSLSPGKRAQVKVVESSHQISSASSAFRPIEPAHVHTAAAPSASTHNPHDSSRTGNVRSGYAKGDVRGHNQSDSQNSKNNMSYVSMASSSNNNGGYQLGKQPATTADRTPTTSTSANRKSLRLTEGQNLWCFSIEVHAARNLWQKQTWKTKYKLFGMEHECFMNYDAKQVVFFNNTYRTFHCGEWSNLQKWASRNRFMEFTITSEQLSDLEYAKGSLPIGDCFQVANHNDFVPLVEHVISLNINPRRGVVAKAGKPELIVSLRVSKADALPPGAVLDGPDQYGLQHVKPAVPRINLSSIMPPADRETRTRPKRQWVPPPMAAR